MQLKTKERFCIGITRAKRFYTYINDFSRLAQNTLLLPLTSELLIAAAQYRHRQIGTKLTLLTIQTTKTVGEEDQLERYRLLCSSNPTARFIRLATRR